MLTGQKYSLLIPTFNRPSLLDALLGYLAEKEVSFPILVLDSSSDENKCKNEVVADRYDLNVRHLKFDERARFDFKIGSALREVDSEYVSLCADDDIVFIDAIDACINEMDRREDLAACHGIYLNYSLNHSCVELRVEYASPSIDTNNAIGRACQLLLHYEALNYAVYRRTVMVNLIDAVSLIPESMFWELFSSVAPLVSGKVKRLPRIYYARRGADSSGRTNFHPATWIAEDPDGFAKAFVEYRERLFAYCKANAVDIGSEARKTLTQAHVIYLCRALHDGETIKRALAGTLSPLATVGSELDAISPLIAPNRTLIARLLAPDGWLVNKIRKKITEADVVDFTAHNDSVKITSSRSIRAILTDDVIADLSRYSRTSAGL